MGLLGRLFKVGFAAGTAYAAVKIGEKYKEKNPEGDPNNPKTADSFHPAVMISLCMFALLGVMTAIISKKRASQNF